MAKQTVNDRLRRLRAGCCPVHGIRMPQEGNDLINGQHIYIVGCPRRDCEVRASQIEAYGEATLLPRYAHLIGPAT